MTAMTITKIMIITVRTTSATHSPAAMASAISSTVAATALAAAAIGDKWSVLPNDLPMAP